MELKNIYLMWVGADHYPTIESYVKEAADMGVSKRLPNVHIAAALNEPDTVVFVAHDERESEPCPDCAGPIENPEWRKVKNMAERYQRHLTEATDQLAAVIEMRKLKAEAEGASFDPDTDDDITKLRKQLKTKERRLEKQVKLLAATPRVIEVGEGTGGYVEVDGERWDFRKWTYWLHQPSKFDPDSHKCEEHQCGTCGGKGRLPLGKVFGMFIPSAVEYILKPEDDAKVKAEMEAKGFRVVEATAIAGERKRGCGKRKHGGYYAVTDEAAKAERAEDAVKKLVEAGLIDPEGAQVNGDFIEFLKPVAIPGTKRFRGIKSWSLDPEVEDEAEMIMEALA